MELPEPPCPRCGGTERHHLGENRYECTDCGLGSTMATLTFGGSPGSGPDPRAQQHLARSRDQALALLAAPPFALYGLDDRWMGPRFVGGHGSGGDGVDHVTLAHGDGLSPDGPLIRVETHGPGNLPPEVRLAFE